MNAQERFAISAFRSCIELTTTCNKRTSTHLPFTTLTGTLTTSAFGFGTAFYERKGRTSAQPVPRRMHLRAFFHANARQRR